MTAILIFLIVVVLLAIIAGPIIFLRYQRLYRYKKNYERGLKTISLLIHLPPPSDDTQVGQRDTRDVVEENISRAQTIYNVIASSLQKGFKHTFYGQRHFAFEIVGSKGFIDFYAAVPISLIDLVKQAVISAYPAAQIEEVPEHNIFNAVGKINATLGGEFTLKENFAYPVATYQEIKRDTMQSILNALSTLSKEDGVAIQMLMRPADPGWRKTASQFASAKREGKDPKQGGGKALGLAGDMAKAFVKSPDKQAEDKNTNPKKALSSMENSILDSIDEKTRYPGYETLIRVVTSSNVLQRSQAILNNVVAAFALFDAPGRNGFKFVQAQDIEILAQSYIMRFFPQTVNKNILNTIELATLFHFPDQANIPTSQLQRQGSKQVDGPRNIPESGSLLGYNVFRNVKKPIRLNLLDRQRHMYVVGQTGTGKSTFLENLALQDMLEGNGFAFVDPHGDTAEKLLAMVPQERTEDVIYFSPADTDYPMGLNIFEFDTPDQKDFLIQEALNMLYKLYDPQHQGIIGPRYEHLFRNAALTVMADPAGGTFVDIPKLFRDTKFVQQKLKHVSDPNVLEFWQKEMPQSQRSNDFGEVVSWFVSKFGAFLSNEMMRHIIGQPKSAFNLREIMDNKKILLVNLSKGRTGELNSKLLGMIFVMKFQAAAMSRANIPEAQRVDFSLYVDEFQNFSTDSFATIMSEARKYHLNLIVANQFTTQLTEEIRDAVFGNMGTIVSFRVGQNDVDILAHYFQPTFEADDLLRVPNYNTITRTLINGVPTNPFSMSTLPPLGKPNDKLLLALKQLSSAKYGRPKAEVEAEISQRLATQSEAAGFGGSAGSTFAGSGGRVANPALGQPGLAMPPATNGAFNSGGQAGAGAGAQAGGSSFLDDWLAKKRQNSVAATPQPAGSNAPASYQPVPGSQSANNSQAQQPANTLSQTTSSSSNVNNAGFKANLGEGEISLKTGVNTTGSDGGQDNTIYIDREGNLHQQ
ncbi:MAG: type IV secretory system conjugative DNA transfer family protein [Candidatus Saccharimonadales bacterium]